MSFQEDISCVDDDVMREVRTVEQMMDEEFAFDVSDDEEGKRKMSVVKLNFQ